MKHLQNFSLKKRALLFLALFASIAINAQSWNQIGSKIEGDHQADQMGFYVSSNASGTIFASSSTGNDANANNSGQVRVYEYQSGDWLQKGQDILGDQAEDLFGFSLDLNDDGTILAIGAPSNSDGHGYVRVFEYQGGNWTQIGATISGENLGDQMGYSVSLNGDGTILAVGANQHNNGTERVGQVKVFQFQSSVWNSLGNTVFGENAGDILGTSLSLNKSGNRFVSGGTSSNTSFSNAGHVKVFELVGATWELVGSPFYGQSSAEGLGYSVSFNDAGTIVAMSALGNDDVFDFAGRVSIYEFDGLDWVQIGSTIYGTHALEFTGDSISLNHDGNIIAIGGSSNSIVGPFAGFTRVFQNQSGTWVQIGGSILAESFGDACGSSVSFNAVGDQVVIGSASGYNSGDESGHTRVFEIDLSSLSVPDENITAQSVSLFPNPSADVILIDSSMDIESVKIYDISGRLFLKQQLDENMHIRISELPRGVYFVQLTTKSKSVVTKKLLKR
ncbi:T9SS type A sorting domain-containing protein [Flavobacteriaceae bacterium S356]|uniref:T9SS type A sorting domain-containing protein n=1 Tax=Asprobacillus argus TaxID=3076534 RepID=A0ABU3LDR6_9FLAO|nr:T9SS type A sorting domain-containing protein [Flavobacteriaceae bacterium S356]